MYLKQDFNMALVKLITQASIIISMYFQMPYSIVNLTTDQVSETYHYVLHSTVLQ